MNTTTMNTSATLVSKPTKTNIKIVDSIMGSGKTSWAIQYMNDAPLYKKFIYITPFLNEVDRVLKATNREFVQPENMKGKSKLDNLKKLIVEGEDVVSTHALFQRFDKELIELIEVQGYTLILDEVMNVIEQADITKDDLQVLLSAKTKAGEPLVTVDKKGFVQWNKSNYSKGKFTQIRNLAKADNLMIYEDMAMYWLFPVSAFKGFEEIYVLTYMFDGQLQRYYYDLFDLEYTYNSVAKGDEGYQLVDYIPLDKEDRKHLKNLINLHYSKPTDKVNLNKIGDGRFSFSKSHLSKAVENDELRKLIKNNGFNFFFHKMKVSSDEVMWTTFKDFEKKLFPKNLRKQFVEVTARATNDYADKTTCIYFANRFMNPVLKKFFHAKNVKVNEDIFALSELLQWLFRSRIRNNQPINVYIPSERMRLLLEEYLNNN
jgi:hypothetical protein